MINVIVSGVDGSGKTSVIDSLRVELDKRGYSSAYVWLRMNHYLVKVMHALARVFGLSVKVDRQSGGVYEHRFYKSGLFSWFYVRCCFIDTLLSRFKLFRAGRGVDFLICDRWLNDIVIDVGVKTHYCNSSKEDILSSRWFGAFQSIAPDNCIQFMISRDEKSVVECREENREDPDFKLRYCLYEKLKGMECVSVVDNNGSVRDSVSKIIDVLKSFDYVSVS